MIDMESLGLNGPSGPIEPPGAKPPSADSTQLKTGPGATADPIQAMAASHAGALAQRFVQQFGYAPADEIVFGWQMEAEAKLQAAQGESERMLQELESKLDAFESAFEANGLPKCAGKHFVNLVKENGIGVLEETDLQKLAIAQAIGLAILEGEMPSALTPIEPAPQTDAKQAPKGESVTGDTSTPKSRAKEIEEARKSLRLILKREPTQNEIQEWIDL